MLDAFGGVGVIPGHIETAASAVRRAGLIGTEGLRFAGFIGPAVWTLPFASLRVAGRTKASAPTLWRGITFATLGGSSVLNRRHFLSTTATGIAASLAIPGSLFAQLEKTPPLPDRSLLDKDEDTYWAELRKQFLIPTDEVYLNNGTVGSSPAPVLHAIFDGYTTTEKMDQQDPEDYPIWGYAAWNEFRDPLAEFVGCKRDEIALLRNATEANSYIANGIEMQAGDEVLMTDQEHPGGEHPWNLKAKRYGVVVKKVTLPRPVKDAAQVLNLFNDAITPRTRVLFFSHITTVTG